MSLSCEAWTTIKEWETFIDRVREQRRQEQESPNDIRCQCKLCTAMWYK